MISFIVIGRNESLYLKKCFQSIFETIKYSGLNDCEIIYIDSNSDDNSIEIALQYPSLKIIRLTSDYNSAIARNLGADLSKNNILFFIDGDMEINPEFWKRITDNKDLEYGVIIGKSTHNYYNNAGDLLYSETEVPRLGNLLSLNVRGWFVIKKDVWCHVGGMKAKLKSGQDREFFRTDKK